MSDDKNKNLPSIDDFEESNQELPSLSDLVEEKDLPSVESYIEKEEETQHKGPNTVNNARFVGSTAELAKLLKNGTKEVNK